MNDEELQKLGNEAIACHENKEFERELELWIKISEAEPDNPHWKHNVAFALMNSGRLIEALELFDSLAENHPELSRVHNNRAILLMRLGVDQQYLIPAFIDALATSRDLPEFLRHFMNLCVTVAFGLDEGANTALNKIEEISLKQLERGSPPEQFEKNAEFLREVLAAYRKIAFFREALTKRKWRIAETELNAAETKLRELGLDNFVRGLQHVKHTSILCRDVVEVIERLGADSSLSPSSVLERLELLFQSARSLAETERHSALSRLLDVLGWFLAGIAEPIRFLVSPFNEYSINNMPRSAITQLTLVSFSELGNNLASLLQFVDRQCALLAQESESLASNDNILAQRNEAWARIALFCNGLIFDFKAIDIALAREVLGWPQDPLEEARRDVQHFRSFIERQAYKDIFVAGRPQENIGRSLLQAFLKPRSYREVQVRGGQTDLLSFTRQGRFLYETKIWRGGEYYQQGLREIEEYLIGESDDDELKGIFYIVFDPTKSSQAQANLKGTLSSVMVHGRSVDVVIISLVPPKPSKKRSVG